ncbi:MAG: adenylate/guanylate cyclase domain-containing protein [Bacteroidales bacterium]|nr:adenylate/guanylate cyclase domain-containing protein [Bacteroidales bacterium]
MWEGIANLVFGERVDKRLPARVRVAIARQQDQSEILIGWTQLLLIGFFIILYGLTPRPSDPTTFTPVPYVLAAFLLISIVRLGLAYQFRLPASFLIVSAVIDIALLLGLIWSFHQQYGQPPSFSLKAPTLLYVFIFIALRALRFQPTYVVVVGVSAAVGWLAMLCYAIVAADPSSGITRDYVKYLTSNMILIGGEVDKVLTMLLVTAILAVALIRARRMLIRAVTDATLARDLTRFVAPEVASRIRFGDRAIQPGDGEVKNATVLFCDIEGFSSISETMAPGKLMEMLNQYFAAIADIVDDEGGVISMFQGDAMLVSFNSARPNPDHAAAALRTALAIQDLTLRQTFGPGTMLRTRCGLSTGELVSGAVGASDRMYFTVYGDEVNIAARLEQLNKAYGTYVLATEQCITAAGDGFPFQPMGSVQVRGREAPVTVYAPLALPSPKEGDRS